MSARDLGELCAALRARYGLAVDEDDLCASVTTGCGPLLLTWRAGDRLIHLLQTTPVRADAGDAARILRINARLGWAAFTLDDETGVLGLATHAFAADDGTIDAALVARLIQMAQKVATSHLRRLGTGAIRGETFAWVVD